MNKEYAGDSLPEIRAALAEEGYTGEVEARTDGFTLYRPFDNGNGELPVHECSQVIVWPRAPSYVGGYWQEEF